MKQVILVRKDLKLPKGKLGVQTAHASVEAVLKTDEDIVKKWRSQGMKKVVLGVEDKEELLRYYQLAKERNFTASLVEDSGRTVVESGTKTCVAVGPAEEEELNSLFSELSLL